ncbi:NosD domain-containing protein [Geoglobus ahangari]
MEEITMIHILKPDKGVKRILQAMWALLLIFLTPHVSENSLAADVSTCQEINQPGYYSLTADLTGSTTCIQIKSGDVIFDGNGHTISGQNTNYGSYGIHVYGSSTLTNVTVRNVKVSGWYAGIAYRNAERGTIAGVNASLNDRGIDVESSNHIAVVDNKVVSNTQQGIILKASNNNTVANNSVTGNENGITLWGRSAHNTIKNNTIMSSNVGIYLGSYGVYLAAYNDYNTIENNLITSNQVGIQIAASRHNAIVNNNVSSNTGDGIQITYAYDPSCYCYRPSNSNTISNNTVSHNGATGISVSRSNYNTITNNTVSFNNHYYTAGIALTSSSHTTVTGNTVTHNTAGVGIGLGAEWGGADSKYNTISRNTVSFNKMGLQMGSSRNNTITGNRFTDNTYTGIDLRAGTTYNTILGNIVMRNQYGVSHWGGSADNNTFYNNQFNNTHNLHQNLISYGLKNVWNTSKTSGTNIVGGPYLGGNFWAKPDGTGFSQTCTDSDLDGICDSPYDLGAGNFDYLPLSGLVGDTVPPVLTLLPPTPIDGSRISAERVTVRLESSEELKRATIEWNGANQSMSGSGKAWESTFDVSRGTYMFRVWGEDLAGNTNSTGLITFTVVGPRIDSCTNIDTDGYYYLTADLSGNLCIVISASNITLDGRFHTISGYGTGTGISAGRIDKEISNITLKNMTVTNFGTGVLLYRVSGAKITHVRSESNTHGIYLKLSRGSKITDSQTLSNVESGIYLNQSASNTIERNVISSNQESGIELSRSSGNSIHSNEISNGTKGIRLYQSSWNSITGNHVRSANTSLEVVFATRNSIANNSFEYGEYGIRLDGSRYNNLFNNTVRWNSESGIGITSYSYGNRIHENNISHNGIGVYSSGVLFVNSGVYQWNKITNNTIELNEVGIAVYGSSMILQNSIRSNTQHGIAVFSSTLNSIRDNEISSNGANGILLRSSQNHIIGNKIGSNGKSGIEVSSSENMITGNSITSNGEYGILLNLSSQEGWNRIYNNYLNNTNNAFFINQIQPNFWNTQKVLGTNIVGGPYRGGNYWAAPDGTGYSQLCEDVNRDGICDAAYQIGIGNLDYFPLTLNAFDPTPLSITFTENSPSNGSIVPQDHIFVEISSSKRLSRAMIEWNGQNVTMTPDKTRKTWSFNMTGLSEGTYSFKVWGKDFAGNWAATETRAVRVDFSATPIDSCTAIAHPGVYVLVKDILSSDASACIIILSDGVKLFGNGHIVEGRSLMYSKGLLISDRGSNGEVVVKNMRFSKWYTGIYISNTTRATLDEIVSTGNYFGLSIFQSDRNGIYDSAFTDNRYDGIRISSSSNTSVINVNASDNGDNGIDIANSADNSVKRSIANSNIRSGISLTGSSNNVVEGAEISKNSIGISMTSYSEQNTVKDSVITSNGRGLYFQAASRNLIYNNYLNNSENHYQLYSTNTFNVVIEPGENVVGGDYIGGNYWSGFSEACGDANGDGICDSTYHLDGNNADHYPLADVTRDSDGDGVSDQQESGDWNGDGISDSQQSDVASVETAESIVAFSSQNSKFSDVRAENISELPQPPADLPYGIYSFNLTVTPGSSVSITVHVYDSSGNPVQLPADMEYWKYTSDGNGSPSGLPGWYSIPATVNGNTVTFTITDGGIGDGDGLANGIIADPGGPGVISATSVPEFSSLALVATVLAIFAIVFRAAKR